MKYLGEGGVIVPVNLDNKVVIAISSRTLFNLDESNKIFEEQGLVKYIEHQISHEDERLEPGVAFSLIKKLLDIKYPDSNENAFEVILISNLDGVKYEEDNFEELRIAFDGDVVIFSDDSEKIY